MKPKRFLWLLAVPALLGVRAREPADVPPPAPAGPAAVIPAPDGSVFEPLGTVPVRMRLAEVTALPGDPGARAVEWDAEDLLPAPARPASPARAVIAVPRAPETSRSTSWLSDPEDAGETDSLSSGLLSDSRLFGGRGWLAEAVGAAERLDEARRAQQEAYEEVFWESALAGEEGLDLFGPGWPAGQEPPSVRSRPWQMPRAGNPPPSSVPGYLLPRGETRTEGRPGYLTPPGRD